MERPSEAGSDTEALSAAIGAWTGGGAEGGKSWDEVRGEPNLRAFHSALAKGGVSSRRRLGQTP